MSNSLSWKPEKRGGIYCSPACGGSCTWDAYNKVLVLSKTLARRLGKGWTSVVHENLGWYGGVVSPCGRIKVHLPYPKSNEYSAVLSEAGNCGGIHWGCSNVPEKAVSMAIASGKKKLQSVQSLMKGLI